MKPSPEEPPLLPGGLWYGPPQYWEARSSDELIEILPTKTPRGLVGWFLFLAAGGLAATPLFIGRPGGPTPGLAWAMSAGVATSLILAAIFIRGTFANERARGPILSLSLASQTVLLPRVGKAWPFDRVTRWQIAHGSSAKGKDGKIRRFASEIAELQICVLDDNGNSVAWPIVGASWRHDQNLRALAHNIAQITDLPLIEMPTA